MVKKEFISFKRRFILLSPNPIKSYFYDTKTDEILEQKNKANLGAAESKMSPIPIYVVLLMGIIRLTTFKTNLPHFSIAVISGIIMILIALFILNPIDNSENENRSIVFLSQEEMKNYALDGFRSLMKSTIITIISFLIMTFITWWIVNSMPDILGFLTELFFGFISVFMLWFLHFFGRLKLYIKLLKS